MEKFWPLSFAMLLPSHPRFVQNSLCDEQKSPSASLSGVTVTALCHPHCPALNYGGISHDYLPVHECDSVYSIAFLSNTSKIFYFQNSFSLLSSSLNLLLFCKIPPSFEHLKYTRFMLFSFPLRK